MPDGKRTRAEEAAVVIVGSCNYDQIVYVPDFPAPGATIYGSSYATGFGGKGANQCVMAARLGASTAMVGALGSDQIGRITRENFAAAGVNTDHLIAKEGASGVAQICVSAKDGNNHIVLVPGANLLLSGADVSAAGTIIRNSKVVLLQNEVPPATTLAAMRAAKEGDRPAGGRPPLVVLNAAPAPLIGGKWQEGQWREEEMKDMLSLCDILCVNESEAEVLSGVAVGGESEDDLRSSALRAAKKLHDHFGAVCDILITLGGRGSCFLEWQEEALDRGYSSHRVPGPSQPVEAVDTSGAGDAYLGAFAAYLAANHDIKAALVLAGQVATRTVMAKGTQSSFPALESLPTELRPGQSS